MLHLQLTSSICCIFLLMQCIDASGNTGCVGSNFKEAQGNEVDDYIIYGITQDCQLFFIRSSQLDWLSTIKVDIKNSYCFPNLVQLHVISHSTILLLIRQAGNRICTLELNIPPPQILFGEKIFSYSLVTSLPYASCSHTVSNDYSLDADLSFMDPAYKDVLYFVDSKSDGSYWTVRQFLIDERGSLKFIDRLDVNNHVPNTIPPMKSASDYVIGLDAQKNYLYKMRRFHRDFVYECAFDLLFRPHLVNPHHGNLTNPFGGASFLNSISVDGKLMVISETIRAGLSSTTFLHSVNSTPFHSHPNCISKVDFSMDVGIIRISTLDRMKHNPLPNFDPFKKRDFSATFAPSDKTVSKTGEMSTQSHKTTVKHTRKHHKSTTVTTTTLPEAMTFVPPISDIPLVTEKSSINNLNKQLGNSKNDQVGYLNRSVMTTTKDPQESTTTHKPKTTTVESTNTRSDTADYSSSSQTPTSTDPFGNLTAMEFEGKNGTSGSTAKDYRNTLLTISAGFFVSAFLL